MKAIPPEKIERINRLQKIKKDLYQKYGKSKKHADVYADVIDALTSRQIFIALFD